MPSKLFSRATNDTLEAILRNDTYRYVRKGFYYKFHYLPKLFKRLWTVNRNHNKYFFLFCISSNFERIMALLFIFGPRYFSSYYFKIILPIANILILITTVLVHSLIYLFATIGMHFISTRKWKIFEKDRISPHVI